MKNFVVVISRDSLPIKVFAVNNTTLNKVINNLCLELNSPNANGNIADVYELVNRKLHLVTSRF